MSFRGRLVGAVSLVTLVTLGGAFTVVSVAVNGAQERRLDDALHAEARREAADVRQHGTPVISDRPGPAANDVGPLPKYAAIYGHGGAVLAVTTTFRGRPPPHDDLRHRPGACFNLWFGDEHLRGIVVEVPGRAGARLLLATPRTDLDGDAAFLARAMRIVFLVAVGWSVIVATWAVRRLTQDHQRVAAVARQVAAGDLSARVGPHARDPELAQLARDVDAMIERLGVLLSAQRQFVAHAAHELRSPLTTLYGELTHALRRPRDAAEYRRVIEDVLDSTRRLKQLAEDLLALARIGAEPPGPDVVLAGACVQEAVRWVARAAQDRRVTITVAGPDAALRGQPRDLARMLRNLLDNALAHAPPDSRVEVTLARREDVVVIAVSDQGPGVPTADRERVFEPFYRGALERAEGDAGAGLGLAIAREIARAHGGDVVLGDAPTRGARFVVTVPCALGAEGHRTSSRTTWTSSQTSSAAAGPGQAGSMNTDVPGETSPAGTGSTVTSATPPPAQR